MPADGPASFDASPAPMSISRRPLDDKAIARWAARHGGALVMRPEQPANVPSVGVVIPCYNYGRYLEGCVASVLSQPGVRVEVIIIDDASSDGSAEVARRL